MLSDSVALSEHDDSTNKFNVEVLTEEQKANIYKFVGDFEASIESKKVKKTSTSNTLMKFVEDAEPAT